MKDKWKRKRVYDTYWNRLSPSHGRCGSCQPCSRGKQSSGASGKGHPWGKPSLLTHETREHRAEGKKEKDMEETKPRPLWCAVLFLGRKPREPCLGASNFLCDILMLDGGCGCLVLKERDHHAAQR